jgi:NAD(P)H-hydrate repair Nnr-like enzyme with NAD(P)H-hydrate dehydratase domain
VAAPGRAAAGLAEPRADQPAPRPHASHKGSYGDVAVLGGEGLLARGLGMTGAALLAASAALHGGAGRVLVAPAGRRRAGARSTVQPELMFRRPEAPAAGHAHRGLRLRRRRGRARLCCPRCWRRRRAWCWTPTR